MYNVLTFTTCTYILQNQNDEVCYGFTTADALSTLHEELENEINQYEDDLNLTERGILLKCFHPNEIKSAFHWTSLIILVLSSVALIIGFGAFINRYVDNMILYTCL